MSRYGSSSIMNAESVITMPHGKVNSYRINNIEVGLLSE